MGIDDTKPPPNLGGEGRSHVQGAWPNLWACYSIYFNRKDTPLVKSELSVFQVTDCNAPMGVGFQGNRLFVNFKGHGNCGWYDDVPLLTEMSLLSLNTMNCIRLLALPVYFGKPYCTFILTSTIPHFDKPI